MRPLNERHKSPCKTFVGIFPKLNYRFLVEDLKNKAFLKKLFVVFVVKKLFAVFVVKNKPYLTVQSSFWLRIFFFFPRIRIKMAL
jgi:hypothetical protein